LHASTGQINYEVAVNANNLAALLHARREYAEAEKLYHQALAIKERSLGAEHPDVAMTLSNLAVLCGNARSPRGVAEISGYAKEPGGRFDYNPRR
jgi:hypothetical protein